MDCLTVQREKIEEQIERLDAVIALIRRDLGVADDVDDTKNAPKPDDEQPEAEEDAEPASPKPAKKTKAKAEEHSDESRTKPTGPGDEFNFWRPDTHPRPSTFGSLSRLLGDCGGNTLRDVHPDVIPTRLSAILPRQNVVTIIPFEVARLGPPPLCTFGGKVEGRTAHSAREIDGNSQDAQAGPVDDSRAAPARRPPDEPQRKSSQSASSTPAGAPGRAARASRAAAD